MSERDRELRRRRHRRQQVLKDRRREERAKVAELKPKASKRPVKGAAAHKDEPVAAVAGTEETPKKRTTKKAADATAHAADGATDVKPARKKPAKKAEDEGGAETT